MLRRCGLCARLLDIALSTPPIQSGSTVFAVASTSEHIFHPNSPPFLIKRSLHRRRLSTALRRSFGSAVVSVDIDDAAIEEHIRHEASAQSSKRIIPSAAWKGKARAEDAAAASIEINASPAHGQTNWAMEPKTPSTVSIIDAIDRACKHGSMPVAAVLSSKVEPPLRMRGLSHSEQLSIVNQKLDNLAPPAPVSDHTAKIPPSDVIASPPSTVDLHTRAPALQVIVSDFSTVLGELLRHDAYLEHKDRYSGLLRKLHHISPENSQKVMDDAAIQLSAAVPAMLIMKFCKFANSRLGMWTPAILEALIIAVKTSRNYTQTPAYLELSLLSIYSASTLNTLLQCYLLGHHVQNAHELLLAMRDSCIHLSPDTFAALGQIDLLLPMHLPLLLTIVESATSFGQPTSTDALNCITAAQIASGHMSAAQHMYSAFMTTAHSLHVKQEISNTLQKPAEATSSSLHCTHQAVQTITKTISKPNQATYEVFLQGYANIGDFDSALDFYVNMIDSGFRVSPLLSAALVGAYVKRGQTMPASIAMTSLGFGVPAVNAADAVQPLSVKSELQQHVIVSNILLRRVLIQSGMSSFTEMINEMSQKSQAVRNGSINHFFAYLGRKSNIKMWQLVSIVEQLRKSCGWKPNASTLNTLLRGYFTKLRLSSKNKTRSPIGELTAGGPARLYEDLRRDPSHSAIVKLIAELHADGARGDNYTSAILMQRMAEVKSPPSRVWDFFKWFLLDNRTRPNEHHLSAIMQAHIAAQDPAGARRAMERCKVLGIQPNQHHYSILITDALARDRSSLAESLVLEMQEHALQPDLHIYVCIANWHAQRGDLLRTKAIVSSAYSQLYSDSHPVAALQACIFKAKHYTRDYLSAQLQIKEDLGKAMIPTRRLYQLVARALSTTRAALVKAVDGNRHRLSPTLDELQEAVIVGKANLARMKHDLPPQNNSIMDDKTLQDAIQAIAHNHRLTRRAKPPLDLTKKEQASESTVA